jgi:hypothetical protein
MKKAAFLTLTILWACTLLSAQPRRAPQEVGDRIEAMRIAFITDRLRLTPEESQRFWPVFNQMEDDLKTNRQKFKPRKDLAEMTDAEVDDFIQNHLDREQKELDIKRAYADKLRKVLPPRKIAMLHMIDQQFKAKLLERARENNPGPNKPRPGLGE